MTKQNGKYLFILRWPLIIFSHAANQLIHLYFYMKKKILAVLPSSVRNQIVTHRKLQQNDSNHFICSQLVCFGSCIWIFVCVCVFFSEKKHFDSLNQWWIVFNYSMVLQCSSKWFNNMMKSTIHFDSLNFPNEPIISLLANEVKEKC